MGTSYDGITPDLLRWIERQHVFFVATAPLARDGLISDSCGFAVPQYRYGGDRQTLTRWSESKGQDGLTHYRRTKNARSLDGLPGLPGGAPGSVDVD